MNQEKFNILSDKEQWAWVLENKGLIQSIELDNDETYINLEDNYLAMKSYIGNSGGAEILLELLGFTTQGV